MLTILTLLHLALNLVFYVVIVQAILSWLITLNVVNRHQPLIHQLWYGLSRATEPLYRPIRRILPDMGGIDFAPLVVIFGIIAMQEVLRINAGLLLGTG